MRKLKYPENLWVLGFGQLWDTFSYYGTQTILALYFMTVFHLSRNDSYALYGAYAGLAYAIPILGGIIADKWLGCRKAMIIGCCMNISGNLLLMFFNRYIFCLGIAISLIGSGLYKSNASNLVGSLYEKKAINKESGFTLFYLSANMGGTLAPVIYGVLVKNVGWNFGFLCSALGIFISALWLIKTWNFWNKDKPSHPLGKFGSLNLYTALMLACIALSFIFYITKILDVVIGVMFLIGIGYILMAISRYQHPERRQLLALILIGFFAMFYFAVGMQIGATIVSFIQSKIQQGVIKTHYPASTFNTLYPLFVLLLAPILNSVWIKLKLKGYSLNVLIKLMLALIFAIIGISIFAVASISSHVLIAIVLGYLFLSAGELTLAPAIYTAMSDYSPLGIKSTMMGCLLLFVGLGGYMSGIVAVGSHKIANLMPAFRTEYTGEFLFIAGFTTLILFIFISMIPKLNQMLS